MTPAARTRAIIAEVAAYHGVPVIDLFGRSQKRRIAYPRQDAMLALRRRRLFSNRQIGRLLGRDASTIFYGIGQAEKRECAQ